jgi:dihydroorotase
MVPPRRRSIGPNSPEASKPLPISRAELELDGNLVTAGWVDLHVHVFEWMTTFGLPPDDAGVHSGVTTAVDQGGAGAYTIPAFRHYIAR